MRLVPCDGAVEVYGAAARAGFACPDNGGGFDAAGCAGEHKARHALGVCERELHAGPTTHGLADDCCAVNAGGVHYGAHVSGEVAGVLVLWGTLRSAPAAMVKGDHPVASGEVGDLLPPDEGVAASAMREDDGWAFAV